MQPYIDERFKHFHDFFLFLCCRGGSPINFLVFIIKAQLENNFLVKKIT